MKKNRGDIVRKAIFSFSGKVSELNKAIKQAIERGGRN
jgi:hypothetical protein